VTYDRAGFGASSPDPEGRSLDRVVADVADVADLLEHLGGRPAVLVAHSWGGSVVRTLAAARPDLVSGLVLVDQTDEGCELYFRGSTMAQQRRFARMLPTLARLGLVRRGVRRLARAFPPDLLADLLASDASVAGARVMSTELVSFEADITRLRDAPPALPPVPVTWISGTKRPRVGAAIRTCLVAAHRAGAAAHPGGRHVEAPRSGHCVHWSEPDLVVTEVLRVASPR
jgi:pimeloyl-ACP methyl ester carboxylesterase